MGDHLRNPLLSIQWDANDFTEEAMKEMLGLCYSGHTRIRCVNVFILWIVQLNLKADHAKPTSGH